MGIKCQEKEAYLPTEFIYPNNPLFEASAIGLVINLVNRR
jgi:hypothetical protein